MTLFGTNQFRGCPHTVVIYLKNRSLLDFKFATFTPLEEENDPDDVIGPMPLMGGEKSNEVAIEAM